MVCLTFYIVLTIVFDFFTKDCGRDLTVTNGQVNFTNILTTAGNYVPLTCDIGYKPTGGTSIECLEDGTWSTVVTCEIIGEKINKSQRHQTYLWTCAPHLRSLI